MKTILIITISFLIGTISSFGQLADHVVIAEIYGGGGNSSSYWTHDYIILYNPTSSSVNVSTWSVQYASSTGSTWQVTPLSGSVAAYSYYSIQEAQGSGGTSPLPFTPNVAGTIAMSATTGKVALVNNQTALSGIDPLPNANIIDFIGYGSSASAFEGTGPTTNLTNTSSARRKDNNGNNTYGTNGSGWDSNDNSTDIYQETDIVNNAPLPVELSSFSAIVLDDAIKLNWRTETEVSNFGFDIERSEINPNSEIPNPQFSKIGFVQGNGNSNSPKNYSFIDETVNSGSYSYRLKQIDTDGQFEYSKIINVDLDSPSKFELSQNFPNPFNPATTISFRLPQSGNVSLKVYNAIGEQVAELINGFKEAGVHTINFDGSELRSGVYFYRLKSEQKVENRKMILLK